MVLKIFKKFFSKENIPKIKIYTLSYFILMYMAIKISNVNVYLF